MHGFMILIALLSVLRWLIVTFKNKIYKSIILIYIIFAIIVYHICETYYLKFLLFCDSVTIVSELLLITSDKVSTV